MAGVLLQWRKPATWLGVVVLLVVLLSGVAMVRWGSTGLFGRAGVAAGAGSPLADASALYRFDERLGTTLVDSNVSHPGRANGQVTHGAWTPGVEGSALDFRPGHANGQHLIAVFPGRFPFHGPSADATLAFWVRPVDATHRTLIWSRGDAHSPDANRFHIYTGGVKWVMGPAIGMDYLSPDGAHHLLFEAPIRLGEWTHIALVRTGTADYTLYINGDYAGSKEDQNPRLPDYDADWALWRMEDNPYPKQNGAIDELALWTRALTGREVRVLARRTP